MSRRTPVVLASCAALLASCHSVARIRLRHAVASGNDRVVLDLWVDAPGPVQSDPPNVAYDVLMPLVLYPVDKLGSLVVAVQAPFDRDLVGDGEWPGGGAALHAVAVAEGPAPISQLTRVRSARLE